MKKNTSNSSMFKDPRDEDKRKVAAAANTALLNKAYDRLVGTKLLEMKQAQSAAEQEKQDEIYRQRLNDERENATKAKAKKLSKEHLEMARKTGLSGHTIALMMDGTCGGGGGDEGSSSDSSSSSSGSRNHKKKKKKSSSSKSKKAKKEKKAYKRKKSSKYEKKEKKREKKEKKEKHD
ncbi:hypothetical protein ScalyP_jg11815 [Parmales sp. scaly parma]|nr:hypothetical protein ScalyP_jg11815 [Parmales sp. scaly parma]